MGQPIHTEILQHVQLVLVNKTDKCTRKLEHIGEGTTVNYSLPQNDITMFYLRDDLK